MSLDLLAGYTRMVSLGHAAFFGVGAYGMAAAGSLLGLGGLPAMAVAVAAAMALALCGHLT